MRSVQAEGKDDIARLSEPDFAAASGATEATEYCNQ